MSGRGDETFSLSDWELRAELARQVELAGSQERWAEGKGISASQVCEALNGRRGISESMINAMGLLRVTRYLRVRRGNNG